MRITCQFIKAPEISIISIRQGIVPPNLKLSASIINVGGFETISSWAEDKAIALVIGSLNTLQSSNMRYEIYW